eukprot:TRINITY_DN26632_c0_g1_i1.p1 TRINITY_DN26632_c0_g1~~TRINITY_DN26632_c0_g1_i1.p1  ORF type:complete len:322 (+),score=57.60 TRINITY_DN26632_c0_g1_i1:45-968(+)
MPVTPGREYGAGRRGVGGTRLRISAPAPGGAQQVWVGGEPSGSGERRGGIRCPGVPSGVAESTPDCSRWLLVPSEKRGSRSPAAGKRRATSPQARLGAASASGRSCPAAWRDTTAASGGVRNWEPCRGSALGRPQPQLRCESGASGKRLAGEFTAASSASAVRQQAQVDSFRPFLGSELAGPALPPPQQYCSTAAAALVRKRPESVSGRFDARPAQQLEPAVAPSPRRGVQQAERRMRRGAPHSQTQSPLPFGGRMHADSASTAALQQPPRAQAAADRRDTTQTRRRLVSGNWAGSLAPAAAGLMPR